MVVGEKGRERKKAMMAAGRGREGESGVDGRKRERATAAGDRGSER